MAAPCSRRDLLRALLALPIAATLDVEQLLWVPKPIITVPNRWQLNPAENLWWLNQGPWTFWVTNDPEFEFGFTGYVPGEDARMVRTMSQQALVRDRAHVRLMQQIYGAR